MKGCSANLGTSGAMIFYYRKSPMRWALGVALLALTSGCNQQSEPWPASQAPAGFLHSPANQEAGKALFRAHCARCHGTTEEGRSSRADFFQPPAMDFQADRYRSIDSSYLFWRINQGKYVEPYLSRGSVMPAWGHYFSEEQIWQLVAYLHTRPNGGR